MNSEGKWERVSTQMMSQTWNAINASAVNSFKTRINFVHFFIAVLFFECFLKIFLLQS